MDRVPCVRAAGRLQDHQQPHRHLPEPHTAESSSSILSRGYWTLQGGSQAELSTFPVLLLLSCREAVTAQQFREERVSFVSRHRRAASRQEAESGHHSQDTLLLLLLLLLQVRPSHTKPCSTAHTLAHVPQAASEKAAPDICRPSGPPCPSG